MTSHQATQWFQLANSRVATASNLIWRWFIKTKQEEHAYWAMVNAKKINKVYMTLGNSEQGEYQIRENENKRRKLM